ncbi:sugar-binding protein [Streptomyces sulfonofaciens]|uniref:Sugar-binding protein n=1 Tax=Streptomyces sulfonofaciens TaxID=68272 RepID=A0A919L417_9ACTN|nr:extracellular solute-binding protein [Streptomyces sulfonofaciens]GHH83067.1 sugar-binding protein [Streptomyces sulfonofaciens]
MRTSIRGSRRLVAFAVVAALTTGLLAGCAEDSDGGSSNASSGGGDSDGRITLTVGTFGVFGYKQAGLYDEYMKLHPNINIKENVTERNDVYYPKLLTRLQAGSGADDVQAIEIANITEVVQTQADKFEDLSKAGGYDKSRWLDWKTEQATAKDGKLVALGADIGPMAICYRKDLFEKAGLPTDREELSRRWAGNWDEYVDLGKQYMKKAPDGTKFVDSAAGVYNAVISGSKDRYYGTDGQPDYEKSAGRKLAWDTSMKVATSTMSAKLKQFDKPWDQAFANGRFATVSCPPWMLGYIEQKAGAAGRGKWDVAAAPSSAAWGGSFVGVPSQGRHKDEAIKLATWLTAPEQQAKVFAKQGTFPSTPSAYAKLKVQPDTDTYFGQAPLAQIFSDAAKTIPIATYGVKDQQIGSAITDIGVLQVEQQGKSPAQGWSSAVKEIKDVLGE